MFKIMKNWPDEDFDEKIFKDKLNDRIHSYINGKEKEIENFEKWKDKCLKFKKWLGNADFNGTKDIEKYRKAWEEKINSKKT